ncbi:hypothetical protein FHG87_009559 [Trinorchestia longiramus]|nr:hypothetical protein FHG87_009559 [Trinorchestia longiramus]
MWFHNASPSSIAKFQTIQNATFQIASGSHKMASALHLHRETGVLPVADHLSLFCSQYLHSSLRPHHPNYLTFSRPSMQRALSGSSNCPPPISEQERSLPRSTRTLLSQLRSGQSRALNSYQARIGAAQHPTCSACGAVDHTTGHRFSCLNTPTHLTSLNLWLNPVSTATFLFSVPSLNLLPSSYLPPHPNLSRTTESCYIHPAIALLVRPFARVLVVLGGRALRMWWHRLPKRRKLVVLDHIHNNRFRYMGFGGVLGGATSAFYWQHCQVCPFTQHSRFYLFQPEQMQQLDDVVFEEVISTSALMKSDSRSVRRVLRVSNKLVSSVKELCSKKWKIAVVDDNEMNAYCLSSGYIVIHTGMLPHVRTTTNLQLCLVTSLRTYYCSTRLSKSLQQSSPRKPSTKPSTKFPTNGQSGRAWNTRQLLPINTKLAHWSHSTCGDSRSSKCFNACNIRSPSRERFRPAPLHHPHRRSATVVEWSTACLMYQVSASCRKTAGPKPGRDTSHFSLFLRTVSSHISVRLTG